MADLVFNSTPINTNGAFELTEKSSLLKSFRNTYDDINTLISGGGAVTPTAAPANLTDSTGGTPASTLAAMAASVTGVDGTGSNAASLTGVNAQLVIVRNAVASLNAQINALQAALVTSGVLT